MNYCDRHRDRRRKNNNRDSTRVRPPRQKMGAETISEGHIMNYDFNEDDEVLDAADSTHDEKDRDVQIGKKIAREKKYYALVGSALKTKPLDDRVTSQPDEYKSNAESIIGRDLPNVKDADEDDPVLKKELVAERAKIIAEVEQALPINVKDNQAKKQRQAALSDVMQKWDKKLKQDEGM